MNSVLSKSAESENNLNIYSVNTDHYEIVLCDFEPNIVRTFKVNRKEYIEYFKKDVKGELKSTPSFIKFISEIYPDFLKSSVKVDICQHTLTHVKVSDKRKNLKIFP